ncbi:uncharacterized protein K02A2.6-like [Ornithodoros turicata]|uniref:uncharacterized protein K02A2.6-like n=1 Tax=Ornithodoros turicata TaxID=34597 RepID=UPI0031391029
MAMAKVETPQGMCFKGDIATEWKSFKQRFKLYLLATGGSKKSDAEKVALFLSLGGTALIDVYNTLDFGEATEVTPEPDLVWNTVIEKLDKYFAPKENEIQARYSFRCRVQGTDEAFDTFLTDLKLRAKACNFQAQTDKMIRDQVVFGVESNALRTDILKHVDPTLDNVVKICLAHESAAKQLKAFQDNSPAKRTESVINAIRCKEQRSKTKPTQTGSNENKKEVQNCRYCGGRHKRLRSECPAWTKNCAKCGKKNHFAKVCKAGKVHGLQEDSPISSEEEVLHVSTNNDKKRIFATMLLEDGSAVKFQVDSGATLNVIPAKFVEGRKLSPTTTALRAWNRSTVTPVGTCQLWIRNVKQRKTRSLVEFVVVKEDYTPLLGKDVSEKMGLLTFNYDLVSQVYEETAIFDKHNDVFNEELGHLSGKVHLTVDPTVQPQLCTTSRVPVNIKAEVKKLLDKLEANGVITSVDEPTPWVNRMVIAEKKSGEMRICIDPQALNKALQREVHHLPVLDDLLADLAEAKVFSRFDLINGYWHCELDEESSLLTTFQTPFGRKRWLRLPFGLKVSSEIFQKRLQMALQDMPGVVCVADDILVYGVGSTQGQAQEDHDNKVEKLLNRCRQEGIKLNKRKCELNRAETLFLGHRLTKEGLAVDTDKVKTITGMLPPQDVQGVQRFCGMANYLSRYMPRLSSELEPLRRLTMKDTPWIWGAEQDAAFNKVKSMVTQTPVLAYYDNKKELTIQCDASKDGLGAVLLQEGHPLEFASRALSQPETRYAQIEKEMLAIKFALQRFHQYTYGRKTTVITDHKPLQAINE